VTTIGALRAYATLEASILDHGERLTIDPVYRAAFAVLPTFGPSISRGDPR